MFYKSGGKTPLHSAHSAKIANALIKAGADVNAKDKYKVYLIKRNGLTPLHKTNDADITNALIEAGADVNVIEK